MHFLFPTMFAVSPAVGLMADWPWLTVIAGAVVVPLLEWTLGRSPARDRRPLSLAKSSPTFHWPAALLRALLLWVIVQSSGLALAAGTHDWGTVVWLGLSAGYVSGGIGIVLAHELGHRRSALDRGLARALLMSVAYGHYAIEHNRGHHRAAATWSDPATAREHESVFWFLPRYYIGVFQGAVKHSRAAGGPVNEAWMLLLGTVLFYGSIFAVAGVKALVIMMIHAVVAQLLVGTVDYVEHWGLQRKVQDGRAERIRDVHIWDCANTVSDVLLFNLPRHASHHLEPSLICDQLRRVETSPQMPTGYAGMTILAWMPPLYRRVMGPRLSQVREHS